MSDDRKIEKYPCHRYHKELAPGGKLCSSAEEEESLGVGWVDSPAKFNEEPEREFLKRGRRNS